MDFTTARRVGPLVEDRPIGLGLASRLIDPLSRGMAWLGQWFRSPRVAMVYAVWALPLTIMMAVIVPPFTNTDEPFHMLRAVALARAHVIGQRFDNRCEHCPAGSGGASDMAVFYAFGPLAPLSWLPNQPDGQVSASLLAKSSAVDWQAQPTGNVWFGSTAQYPPAFYVPDIAGYWIGRAAGLRVDATLCLCRCLNALTFVALAALAIARARRLRPILAALLMLPMTLALAASASQDAGIIATIALIIAQFDRTIAEGRRFTGRELAFMAAGLACVVGARPPYLPVLLLLLPAAPGRAGHIAAAAAAAVVGLWCLLIAVYVMVPLGEGNPSAELASLLHDPASVFVIAANTLRESGSYAWEFIGKLAWNDRPLPGWFLGLAGMNLLIAAAASASGFRAGRLVAAGVACSALLIFAVQLFDWGTPGASQVVGVQGRYFIPLAIVMALALPRLKVARLLQIPASAFSICLGLVTPAVMMNHVLHHFFIRPV